MSARSLSWIALATAAACATPRPDVADGRYVMGTVLEVRSSAGVPLEPLFARAEALDRELTRFRPESALSRLNDAAGRGPVPVPPDVERLLAFAREQTERTRGAFDPTVGPLVRLWWRAAERAERPGVDALSAARALVGPAHLSVGGGAAELRPAGASVDLGGIAKGYALDEIVALLRENGATGALLDFGGSSLHALGAPRGEPGWRVAVRDASGGLAGVATLRDVALSTSASFGQSFEIDGRRYGHVIDPRSGEPLESARVATVLAPSGAQAEALSKALLILGESEGIALLESLPDVEGILLDADGRSVETAGWSRATSFVRARDYGRNWSSASSR